MVCISLSLCCLSLSRLARSRSSSISASWLPTTRGPRPVACGTLRPSPTTRKGSDLDTRPCTSSQPHSTCTVFMNSDVTVSTLLLQYHAPLTMSFAMLCFSSRLFRRFASALKKSSSSLPDLQMSQASG